MVVGASRPGTSEKFHITKRRHGLCYVAFSRVRTRQGIRVYGAKTVVCRSLPELFVDTGAEESKAPGNIFRLSDMDPADYDVNLL